MKEDWLEKGLEDKLDNYDSPMDLENAWGALQARREKPKKKRRFFFWLFFGLLTLGIGAWGSYFIFNNQSDTVVASKQEPVRETITELEHQSKNVENGFGKTTPNISAVADVAKINSKNQVEKSESPTLKSTEENINTSEKWKRGNQNYSPPTEEATLSSVATSSGNEEINFTETGINLFLEQSSNIHTSETAEGFGKNAESIFILPEEEKQEEVIFKDSIPLQEESQVLAFLPSLKIKLLDFPQGENFNISNSTFLVNNSVYVTTHGPILSIIHPPNYFGLSAGYGTRSTGKVFTDENPLDLTSFQAFYEKSFGRKFYFKTGINFDQMVNSFESSTERILTETAPNQLITVNHFQNGTIEEIFGVGEVSNLEKTTAKNYHRYRLVSIPMMVGYKIEAFHRSTIQIEAGMARSVFTNYSGEIFELGDFDLENRGVWQGIYGLSWNYSLRNKHQLFMGVQGNYHFNEIWKSSQLDLEKFWFHQFQVGLKFRI